MPQNQEQKSDHIKTLVGLVLSSCAVTYLGGSRVYNWLKANEKKRPAERDLELGTLAPGLSQAQAVQIEHDIANYARQRIAEALAQSRQHSQSTPVPEVPSAAAQRTPSAPAQQHPHGSAQLDSIPVTQQRAPTSTHEVAGRGSDVEEAQRRSRMNAVELGANTGHSRPSTSGSGGSHHAPSSVHHGSGSD